MSEPNSEQPEMPLGSAPQATKDRGEVPAYLKPKKNFQIAVSGGVLATEIERQIIDTPDFQRLRGIRQLGLAHLVYPTALHTRFDHSLGTLQMAARMIHANGRTLTSNRRNGLSLMNKWHWRVFMH